MLATAYLNPASAIDTPNFTLESRRWEQITVPAASSNHTVRELFSDDLPAGSYGTLWAIFQYDGNNSQYENPGIDGTLGTGTGFWIIQMTGSSVVLDLPQSVSAAGT